MGIKFTRDPKKAKRNMQRHGVSFGTGTEVFDDPFLLVVEDCEDEYGELRYQALGRAHSELLLVVVHVDRSTDEQEIIHIISVRKAEDYEQTTYADQFA